MLPIAEVTELMAVRIRNFGGVVQELAPGASLDRDDMRLVFCRTASRLAYLAYVTRGLLRLSAGPSRALTSPTARESLCRYQSPSSAAQQQRKIYVEADGELLGTLPAEITVVPERSNPAERRRGESRSPLNPFSKLAHFCASK